MTSGGRAVLVRDAEQAIAVANLVAPEHLELLTRDADELVHEVRHAGAVFVGTPTAIGDYVAGANHVLPTGGAARFSSALRVDDFRRHMHVIRATPEGLRAIGPAAAALARGRGPRGARRVGRAAHRPMIRIEPRADLRELAGYHSPQLDVSVRLNTNESPYPPPPEFVDAWLGALASAPLHRYPDRAATDLRAAIGGRLGQPAARVFPANGSNEVLQTLLLTYGGPGRRVLVFEPTYALHGHIARITGTEVVVRGRDATTSSSTPTHAVEVIEREQPDDRLRVQPQQPVGHGRAADDGAGDRRLPRPASSSSTRPTASSRRPRRSSSSTTTRPLVVTRTYSKVWSLAALRLGFAIAPASVVAELDKVVLPYHLDVATQTAGILALRPRRRDGGSGRATSSRNGSGSSSRSATSTASRCSRPAPTSCCSAPPGGATPLWDAMVDDGVLVRDFSGWPGVEDCLRVTVGTPDENDAFLTALARRPARAVERQR